MAWDLTVMFDNRPGTLADLGDAVGKAGVNLAGCCGVVSGDAGTIHLLVDDGLDVARDAISGAGMAVSDEREVLVVDVQDQLGTLGSYARRLAAAGVNIELFYVATGTRLVFGVDDLDAVRGGLIQSPVSSAPCRSTSTAAARAATPSSVCGPPTRPTRTFRATAGGPTPCASRR